MLTFLKRWRYGLLALMAGMFVFLGSDKAADINPAYVAFKLPSQIQWMETPGGAAIATIQGDPNKEGALYIQLLKWHPGHMSRPHWHPNDRYITVLSGTWWVGTGTKYDPDSTVPMPPGSFVTDLSHGIHYDGAKDVECVLEIVGIGPATSNPAEVK